MTEDDIKNRHMNPDEIEKYSMGKLSKTETAPVDEHLLVCEKCRTQVEASDAFVAAMRAAAKQIGKGAGKTKPRNRSGAKTTGAVGRIG